MRFLSKNFIVFLLIFKFTSIIHGQQNSSQIVLDDSLLKVIKTYQNELNQNPENTALLNGLAGLFLKKDDLDWYYLSQISC